ncbi:MAG: guanosine-3' 5'-bis(diphosphate) 3'-pyrophosphohydrolase [Gammaproteobacteria bacterium]|nr:MAG: guanosine-3' 5'-bis(diphosphate) 3'-pyrophosphohydrolase [Gammaproteobacteria bacterium]TND02918.1 MAG: guanosine-3',5'-bis(diphosphate) 3'-pyrophosphohydrolase [Gammaproteobacteria bacterium]
MSTTHPDLPVSAREPDTLIGDLCSLLEKYLDKEQVDVVYKAYLYGAEAHMDQRRMSGEPYIHHPLAVARILADMRLDYQSIAAALLHDVIEDTLIPKEHLIDDFGEEIAELVDGVTKLTQIKFKSRATAEAENFRKMILAMVRDIRVIIIKLADRMHNLRTLGVLPPKKRRRIARETLEIYAPIANRLGMNSFRTEMQEIGFAALYPMRYRILAESVRKARGNRKEVVQKIENAINQRLLQEGLNGRIVGREKNLYSIYQKMLTKHLSFSEVFDVYAFRIIVDSVDACYRVLGAIHNLYKPVPGKFKDYIAIPKANGYQSLHTILFGPYGVPIEVQIRTEEMNKVGEIGVAAHWLYKSGEGGSGGTQMRVREWLRELLEMQRKAGNSLEFLENVKIDLFPDEVYVFTPKGKIMQLPLGSTAVDFAYAVHTDVGNSCVAAKIDRRLAPLSTVPLNGQTVEIITAPGAKPNPVWLNFVVTGKARGHIRHFLKNLRRDESVELGKRMLDTALAAYSMSLKDLPDERRQALIAEYKVTDVEDLYADIGLGNRLAPLVARWLSEGVPSAPRTPRRQRGIKNVWTRYAPGWLGGEQRQPGRPLAIKGTEGMVVSYAKCCRPIPGDSILGLVTAGRGIVVHVDSCKNVASYSNASERRIDVQWEPNIDHDFPVDIRVEAINQRGVLATVAATIADMKANIENVAIEERDGRYSVLNITLTVRDRQHLANIIRRLRSVDAVARISRTKS